MEPNVTFFAWSAAYVILKWTLGLWAYRRIRSVVTRGRRPSRAYPLSAWRIPSA